MVVILNILLGFRLVELLIGTHSHRPQAIHLWVKPFETFAALQIFRANILSDVGNSVDIDQVTERSHQASEMNEGSHLFKQSSGVGFPTFDTISSRDRLIDFQNCWVCRIRNTIIALSYSS